MFLPFLSSTTDPQLKLVFFIVFVCCFIPICILVIICFIKTIIKHHKKVKKFNKKKLNDIDYLSYFGSSDNIISVSKNLSRVTVVVKTIEDVNLEALKNSGMGVMVTGNTIKCSSQAFADQIKE